MGCNFEFMFWFLKGRCGGRYRCAHDTLVIVTLGLYQLGVARGTPTRHIATTLSRLENDDIISEWPLIELYNLPDCDQLNVYWMVLMEMLLTQKNIRWYTPHRSKHC